MEIERQIFLVDDNASIRKAMRRFLSSAGVDVQIFASAEEFLDFISPRVSGCLILDVRLPGLSGLELQERLTQMESHLRIIFITAFSDAKLRERALASGAVAFLEKPVDHQQLLQTIMSIWNGDKVDSDLG